MKNVEKIIESLFYIIKDKNCLKIKSCSYCPCEYSKSKTYTYCFTIATSGSTNNKDQVIRRLIGELKKDNPNFNMGLMLYSSYQKENINE